MTHERKQQYPLVCVDEGFFARSHQTVHYSISGHCVSVCVRCYVLGINDIDYCPECNTAWRKFTQLFGK